MNKLNYRRLYLALSFILPFAVLGGIFIYTVGIPFIPQKLFDSDMYQQYYPFLNDYWHRIRNGHSLLWSWSHGGGSDYFALWAYYLTSPLYIFLILLPNAWLAHGIVILILIKIGLAGMFMSIYLTYANNGEQKPLLPVFSAFYALCGFAISYYYNILWLDTFALFPLVITGVMSLMRDDGYKLYIITLALSFFTNFHFSLYTCIFVLLFFIGQCITMKLTKKDIMRRFVKIAGYSLISAGLAAFIFFGVYTSARQEGISPALPPFELYNAFTDILGNFIGFATPSSFINMPSLYSGMLIFMLSAVFLSIKKIPLREKTVFIVLTGFIVLCSNHRVLDFLFNGFYIPRGMPQRYTFLVSFLLAGAAYKAYLHIDEIRNLHIAVMSVLSAAALYIAFLGIQAVNVLGNIVLCVGYLVIFWLYAGSRSFGAKNKEYFRGALLFVLSVVMLTELTVTVRKGVSVNENITDNYLINKAELTNLARETSGNADYFRTETDYPTVALHKSNDSSLYGYNGLSVYTSTVNTDMVDFYKSIGLFGASNALGYPETTPVVNAFFAQKYMLSQNTPADTAVFWEQTDVSAGGASLYRNKYYLPFGFMVSDNTAYYAALQGSPIASQNSLFSLATGIDGDCMRIIEPAAQNHLNYAVTSAAPGLYEYVLTDRASERYFSFDYIMPEDSVMYVYLDNIGRADISVNGGEPEKSLIIDTSVRAAGFYKKGDLITLRLSVYPRPQLDSLDFLTDQGNSFTFYTAAVNKTILAEGYSRLADTPLNLINFTDTNIKGEITAKESGLLYMSVPYKNRWRAYVNGSETDITAVGGCMAGIPLDPGTHIIELKYYNKPLTAGVCISAAALAVFIYLTVKRRVTPLP